MADNKNIIFEFQEYLIKISGIPAYIQKNDIGANALLAEGGLEKFSSIAHLRLGVEVAKGGQEQGAS